MIRSYLLICRWQTIPWLLLSCHISSNYIAGHVAGYMGRGQTNPPRKINSDLLKCVNNWMCQTINVSIAKIWEPAQDSTVNLRKGLWRFSPVFSTLRHVWLPVTGPRNLVLDMDWLTVEGWLTVDCGLTGGWVTVNTRVLEKSLLLNLACFSSGSVFTLATTTKNMITQFSIQIVIEGLMCFIC